jgi:hypothetical protein
MQGTSSTSSRVRRVALLCVVPLQAANPGFDKEAAANATLEQAWDAQTMRDGAAFWVWMDPGAPAGSKGAEDSRSMALQPKKMISFNARAPPHPARRAPCAPSWSCASSLAWRKPGRLPATGQGLRLLRQGLGQADLQRRFDQGSQDWSEWLAQPTRWREKAARKAASPK